TAVADASTGWKTVRLPGDVPAEGIVWLRREATLDASAAGKELVVDINEIVGVDTVYWNGREIGGRTLGNYTGDGAGRKGVRRRYRVPADAVAAGTHTLALRIYAPREKPALRGGYFSAGPR